MFKEAASSDLVNSEPTRGNQVCTDDVCSGAKIGTAELDAIERLLGEELAALLSS